MIWLLTWGSGKAYLKGRCLASQMLGPLDWAESGIGSYCMFVLLYLLIKI